MISKEIARKIYNAYTEIEQAKLMIEELKKSITTEGEAKIKDNWGHEKGLQLHIPSPSGGYKIQNVPFKLALDTANAHVAEQENELQKLKEICRVQLA